MDFNPGLYFGLCSAVLGLAAFAPYIWDTLFGDTRPLRSTWLVWTALSGLSLCSNISEGATTSLLYIGGQTAMTALIFVLSLRKGVGSLVQDGEGKMLGCVVIGIALWWMTDNAVYALVLSLLASAMGGVFTVIKAYRAPRTESMTSWAMATAAAFGGTLAVGAWDAILLAYPVYLTLLYATIFGAAALGRAHQRAAMASGPLVLDPTQRVFETEFAKAA